MWQPPPKRLHTSNEQRATSNEQRVMMEDLDWRWIKSFVAVAEGDGVLVAAEKSGISQPTLSRHIKQLEDTLGFALFERSGRGMKLSPQGAELLERARLVQFSVKSFERRALSLTEEKPGSVRVTMTFDFSHHFAPQWLRLLKKDHPDIVIDLVPNEREVNLLLREADIALRLVRPKQLDLLSQYCCPLPRGLFASQKYIDEHGAPETIEQLKEFDLIGFDQKSYWIDAAHKLGHGDFERDDFHVRCDIGYMHAVLAHGGMGIAVVPLWIGERWSLPRIIPQIEIPGEELYLTAHSDLHGNPQVLKVWRHLYQTLQEKFMPRPPTARR